MRANTLLSHFTDCTLQFHNKAMQNQAVNRLKSAGEGKWLCATPGRPQGRQLGAGLGLTSLGTPQPVSTSVQGPLWQWQPRGLSPGQGHLASPCTPEDSTCSSLPQNYPLDLMGNGECPAHLITRVTQQGLGAPCSAALWCQPLPKHSADPPASEHRDSKGREALRDKKVPPHEERDQPWAHSRVEGPGPCQTAARPRPCNPCDTGMPAPGQVITRW